MTNEVDEVQTTNEVHEDPCPVCGNTDELVRNDAGWWSCPECGNT